jgi:hypothetical protein
VDLHARPWRQLDALSYPKDVTLHTRAKYRGRTGPNHHRELPIGFADSEVPSVLMNLPLLKNYSIIGVFTGAWMERFLDDYAPLSNGGHCSAGTLEGEHAVNASP